MTATDSKLEVVTAGKVVGFFILYGVSILSTILAGYAFRDLWTWFIVPLGAAPVSVVQAIGVTIFVALLTRGLKRVDIGESKTINGKFGANIAFYTITTLIIWASGAIWHLFL